MKIFYKKTSLLILLLCAWTVGMSQSLSYKSLTQELLLLQKQLVPDKRVAILEIELKDTLHPEVVVSGKTNLPEARKQITGFMTDRNISFIDSIRLLPDSSLGEKIWALGKLSVSNVRALPKDASELVSQVMMGTPMKILDYVDKWYLVQTPEYYIGWMDTSGLQTITQKEMDRWKGSDRCIYNGISGFVYDAPGKKGEIISDIVLGGLFEAEPSVRGFLKILIPDGRIGYVKKADCITFKAWITAEPKIQPALSVARTMMGFPYLWGGASSKAVDCSGFVKLVYYMQGIILARDASQQASFGDPVDFSDRNNLQPGDLLFFGSSIQHITHMGIYLGNGKFIHASGMVRINSIEPGDPGFMPARKTLSARRIMNSLNTDGIVLVKDHPWYNIQH